MKFRVNKYIKYSYIFIVILLFLTCIHPTFLTDESFTMGLITHNIHDLINLDAMDVHPPLYYLILKIFLFLTTFWTKSMFIKVLMSRSFSILCFILFCMIISKILYLFKIKYNNLLILLILLMPTVIVTFTKIRMYGLVSLFLLFELYELLRFDITKRNLSLILATISSILSVYTFYFAGLSAGLFIVIFIILNIYKKRKIYAFKLFISGILLVISFLPWLPVLLQQLFVHMKTDKSGSYDFVISTIYALSQMGNHGIVSILFGMLIIIILIVFIIYGLLYLNNNFRIILICSLVDLIITLVISLISCGRNFQPSAVYPIFIICVSFILIVPSNILHEDINIRLQDLVMMSLMILVIYSVGNIYKNIKTYDLPSVSLIRNECKWRKMNSKNIKFKNVNYPINKQMTISEDSVYLYSLNKNIQVKNYDYSKMSSVLFNSNKNIKLVKGTFTNLEIEK